MARTRHVPSKPRTPITATKRLQEKYWISFEAVRSSGSSRRSTSVTCARTSRKISPSRWCKILTPHRGHLRKTEHVRSINWRRGGTFGPGPVHQSQWSFEALSSGGHEEPVVVGNIRLLLLLLNPGRRRSRWRGDRQTGGEAHGMRGGRRQSRTLGLRAPRICHDPQDPQARSSAHGMVKSLSAAANPITTFRGILSSPRVSRRLSIQVDAGPMGDISRRITPTPGRSDRRHSRGVTQGRRRADKKLRGSATRNMMEMRVE
jgi:hypothetical protein